MAGLMGAITGTVTSLGKYVKLYWKQTIAVGAAGYVASKSIDSYEDGDEFKHLMFPLEKESIGGFQSWLNIKSWKKQKLGVNGNGGPIVGFHAMDIFLPMPLSLSAQYAGKFDEADGVSFQRNSSGMGSFADRVDAYIGGSTTGAIGFTDDFLNNDSSAMAGNTVHNNKAGALYKGQNLRSHTFSWRLTPKSKEEQDQVDMIVFALKLASTGASASADSKISEGELVSTEKFVADIRLTIPHTVRVTFLDDGEVNRHLFKTKDCFITSLDVNYTTTGTWAAHMDGSPIETQITINLKEITPVTQQEISMQGF